MKLITYIKYFHFLWDNWDLKIAWYMIKQEIWGERKYAINTTGADELLKLEEMGIDVSHATIYMPVSFNLMEEILQQLRPVSLRHFLDMGCGKGRAMCIAAHYGFDKVTGIDLSKDLCQLAEKNLTKTKWRFPKLQYKLVNNDAFYFEIPNDADCLFFFNPFDEIIMSAVVNNIFESLDANPRKLRIIYVNPLHKEQFLKAGYKQIWHCKKMEYLEAVILEN